MCLPADTEAENSIRVDDQMFYCCILHVNLNEKVLGDLLDKFNYLVVSLHIFMRN